VAIRGAFRASRNSLGKERCRGRERRTCAKNLTKSGDSYRWEGKKGKLPKKKKQMLPEKKPLTFAALTNEKEKRTKIPNRALSALNQKDT